MGSTRRRNSLNQTRQISSSSRAGNPSSWVRTGMSSVIAVAAIHESFTPMRRPESRRRTRSCAQRSATLVSMGTGSRARAAVRVRRRKSRVARSFVARTPARSSAIVMTDTASSLGRWAGSICRPVSSAMKIEVSANALLVTGAARRSCLVTGRKAPAGVRSLPVGLGQSGQTSPVTSIGLVSEVEREPP